MSNFKMLNNVEHKDLRVIAKKSAKYGDNIAGSLIFPEEFIAAQKDYPIFFQKKKETGELQSIAIFGFFENENLFLNGEEWSANYIPAVMEREPFLIGFQRSNESVNELSPVIHIDLDSSRISTSSEEGELVFLEHGGNSPYIDRISKMLMLIHEGLDISKDMFKAFMDLDLIEPFVLDVEFNGGEICRFESYYTINQERFFALEEVAVGQLHRLGYLQYAYMVISSLGNIQKLIDLRQKR